MIPLSHQVNNKPLIIALGVAFVLHFLFTLTYHIDFEWTAPKPGVLTVTIKDAPTKTTAVEPEVIKPTPVDKVIPTPSKPRAMVKAEPERPKTDYLDSEKWVIAKKLTKEEHVQKIFVGTPAVTAKHALSLYLFEPEHPFDKVTTNCTSGVRNYVFINCPNDSLQLASIGAEEMDSRLQPLLVMPTSKAPRYALSTPTNPRWYNEVERKYENWTHLAGLPTVSVPFN